MKRLVDAIIKKWFCLHEWEFVFQEDVEISSGGLYHVYHFFCKKCGKYKRIKTY